MAYKDIEVGQYTIKDYQIPFEHGGAWENGKLNRDGSKTQLGYGEMGWKDYYSVDNYVFSACLYIERVSRGRSSTKVHLKDISTGDKYEMFPSDFVKMLQQADVHKGVVAGTFSFVKRGANFGMIYLGD